MFNSTPAIFIRHGRDVVLRECLTKLSQHNMRYSWVLIEQTVIHSTTSAITYDHMCKTNYILCCVQYCCAILYKPQEDPLCYNRKVCFCGLQ